MRRAASDTVAAIGAICKADAAARAKIAGYKTRIRFERRRAGAEQESLFVELSPEDITALRAVVKRRTQLAAGRSWPVVRLVGGPLAGMWVKLPPAAARCGYVGFCHLTRHALAQVMYHRRTPRAYVFDTIHWPTARAAELG